MSEKGTPIETVHTTEKYKDSKKVLKVFFGFLLFMYLLEAGLSSPSLRWITYGFVGSSPFVYQFAHKLVSVPVKTVIELPFGVIKTAEGDYKIGEDQTLGMYKFPLALLIRENWIDKKFVNVMLNKNTKTQILICERIDWKGKVMIGSWLSGLNPLEYHKTILLIFMIQDLLQTEVEKNLVHKRLLKTLSLKEGGRLNALVDELTYGDLTESLSVMVQDDNTDLTKILNEIDESKTKVEMDTIREALIKAQDTKVDS